LQQRQSLAATGQKFINKNTARDGDFWEYYVGLEAWKRDVEVFKNLGKSGDVDLILVKDGETLLCDVKQNAQQRMSSSNDPGWYQFAIARIASHVTMICVHPITLEISWHKKRIPKGWEDFWK
jgi:hypothetical protein